MIFFKKSTLLVGFLFCSFWLNAQVTVNHLFANHMVLQQKANIKIWGKASPKEMVKVNVSFLKHQLETTTDHQGNWEVKLKTPQYGGPYQITIKGDQNQISIADVYLGEVWLASGQSNMQFPIDSNSKGYNGVVNFKEEIKLVNFPLIRQFLVKSTIARTEKEEVAGDWLICKLDNVKKISALAYYFALNLHQNLNVPIGIINSSWGGTEIATWMSAKDLQKFTTENEALENITNTAVKVNENYPSALYNGMINPLRKFNIKGVIWCQGENNINDPRNYGDRMKSLISGWRSSFSQKKLPFLYVQIAPFNYLGRTRQYFTGTENSLGYLVEQQTKALTLKHVYMARTGDIGDVGFIHYRNKQEAGKRLFLLALKKVYTNNDDELVNGPQVSNVSFTNNRAIVVYKQIGAGLSIKGSTVNGFELSDDGVKFYPATAKMDGNKVIVQGVNLPKVVALRYCFKNVQEVNLFNAAGLPALPFRTDSTPYVKPVY